MPSFCKVHSWSSAPDPPPVPPDSSGADEPQALTPATARATRPATAILCTFIDLNMDSPLSREVRQPAATGNATVGPPVRNFKTPIVTKPHRFALVPVSYTHLRAHETDSYLVCRLLLEKKKKRLTNIKKK